MTSAKIRLQCNISVTVRSGFKRYLRYTKIPALSQCSSVLICAGKQRFFFFLLLSTHPTTAKRFLTQSLAAGDGIIRFQVSLSLCNMAEAPRNKQLPSGYDEEFLYAVEDDFICLICHLLLKEPVLTRCGHRFCNACLEEYLRRYE